MKIMRRNIMENKPAIKETNIMEGRQAQEVQAAMVVAKRFPRDAIEAANRIRKTCQRKGLAEQAEYSYPRGGKKVTGASIRLAEAIAQNWGNIDYGIIELSRDEGKSEMMAYAWDLETNTRRTMVFTALHIRDRSKEKGGNIKLVDSRDIYELTANLGARRVRACVLSIIPGDIVDEAVEECRKTLVGSYTEPLKTRIKKTLAMFDDKYQVSKEMIEKYFGYKAEAFTEQDGLKLATIYNSLKDGMSKREEWFNIKGTGKPVVEMPKEKEAVENNG
jgi:hypothetical protein